MGSNKLIRAVSEILEVLFLKLNYWANYKTKLSEKSYLGVILAKFSFEMTSNKLIRAVNEILEVKILKLNYWANYKT